MWKNIVAGQATDGNMAHAYCMLDTYGYKHSALAILIAFPLQQWLHECALVLCLHCLSCFLWFLYILHTQYEKVNDLLKDVLLIFAVKTELALEVQFSPLVCYNVVCIVHSHILCVLTSVHLFPRHGLAFFSVWRRGWGVTHLATYF